MTNSPQNPQHSQAQLRAEIEQLSSKLAEQCARARDGELDDLSTLPEQINALCTALGTLPEDERNAMKGGLLGLMEELDVLSELIRKNLAEVQQALKGNTTRNQAARAYGKSTPPSEQ